MASSMRGSVLQAEVCHLECAKTFVYFSIVCQLPMNTCTHSYSQRVKTTHAYSNFCMTFWSLLAKLLQEINPRSVQHSKCYSEKIFLLYHHKQMPWTGEKRSQLCENRKGCVMSFPYQCLATALLTSCPAGLAGICWLTLLPSPTQTATRFVPLWSTLTSRYWLISEVFILLSLMNALMHKGKCFLSATYSVYTSCLFFPTYFSSKVPWSFYHNVIFEVFNSAVFVCLFWIFA